MTIRFASDTLGYHFGTRGARGTRLKYSFHPLHRGYARSLLSSWKLYEAERQGVVADLRGLRLDVTDASS